jgi:hypothetical protein
MEKERQEMKRKMREKMEREKQEMRAEREAIERERQKMEQKVREEMETQAKEDKECVVCLDAEANCLFLNCGHIRVCWDCAKYMEKCCMCQKPTENKKERVYM